MEIKVIGIGPNMQEEAKNLEAAFKKMLGIDDAKKDGATKPEAEASTPDPVESLMSAIHQAVSGDRDRDLAEFRQAKKRIKKAITGMREDGIGVDNAAMALAEVACVFFNGLLKPVDGKTSKEAFMDFIGHVFDVTDERVKEVRAKREAEACNGR